MKLPFWIETEINKLIKPQLVTIIETFIDGKLSKKFYGKSLVANWLQHLYCNVNKNSLSWAVSGAPFNSRTTGLRADTGAASVALTTALISYDAVGGVTNQGILLGSAVGVPAPADFNVGTLIAHGAGAGQLQYGTQDAPQGVTIVGQNSSFIMQRTFTNASGANVTVNMVAIYTNVAAGGLMHYKDAVSPGDVIANGQVYTVQITFQITT